MQTHVFRSSLKPHWHDIFLERYRNFLERESLRSGGGPIADHYLRVVSAHYSDFQATGSAAARFKAWRAVHTTCQWLAQLQIGGQS
jgi:hypothetical protein